MKIFHYSLFVAAAVAALATGCKKADMLSGPDSGEEVTFFVDIIGAGATRATGVTDNAASTEAKVNNLQVFVFNGSKLDGYAVANNSKTIAVSCHEGSREVIAVVNGPDMKAVTTKSALMKKTASLKSGIDNFAMIGSVTKNVANNVKVTVPVDRLVARIVVKGIKNALTNPRLAADFKVKDIYLTNVPADCDFGKTSSYSPSKWYNRRGYEANNSIAGVIYDSVNKKIAEGGTLSEAHYFYTMPNAFEAKYGGPWSARACKLVIRCEIGGVLYDYPVSFPVALESNKSYEISLLTIARTGNEDNGKEPSDGDGDPDDPTDGDDDVDEEKPVDGIDGSFEITVNPWTVVTLTEGTTI